MIKPLDLFWSNFIYREVYAYTIALNIFVLFLSIALLSFLIKLLLQKLLSKNSNTAVITSAPKEGVTSPPKNAPNGETDGIKLIKPSILPSQGLHDSDDPFKLDRKYKWLKILGSIVSWLSYLLFSAIPVCFSAFGYLPIWISVIAIFILLSLRMTQSFYKRCSAYFEQQPTGLAYFKYTWIIMVQRHPKILLGYVFFIILASLLMPLTTYGSCFNDHVEGYGISFMMGPRFVYSSSFTRYLTLPKVCGEGGPCHIYATVPFNTSSSVFINVQTSTQVDTLTINYDTTESYQKTGKLALSQNSSVVVQPDYDLTGERNIHSILLTDLQPNQIYTLEVFYNGASQTIKTYQTLPDSNSTDNYTLIYGGDIGYTTTSQKMAKIVAEKNPRALIIGGDIAYDDGSSSCYYSMDLFLWMMDKEIFEKLGRLVPMLLGLGNHDVGFNSRFDAKMPINDNGPSFYLNFPQNLPVTQTGVVQNIVPRVQSRSAHRAHMIGNVLNVFLDSGYMASYSGAQLEWLLNISETYKDYPKVAIYHDPIFSPCYALSEEIEYTGDDWLPVFSKYKYMVVFENHLHMYKKTFPLVGSKISENGIGTLYLGDGSWGPLGHCSPGDTLHSDGVFESYAGLNHLWVVNVDPSNSLISAVPVAMNNTVIDKPIQQNMKFYSEL